MSRSSCLWICILTTLLSLSGCGSVDGPLDEVGQRYTAVISIQDNDDATLTVDVIRDMCESEPEKYGPTKAEVTITVADPKAPGITLQGYTIEYIPLASPNGVGSEMPPTLTSPVVGGNLGIDILPGGSSTFTITCISTDTKQEFRMNNGWLFYSEDPAGRIALEAKQAEIDAAQAAVNAIVAQIAALPSPPDPTILEALTAQRDSLQDAVDALESEYLAMYYSFVSIPELQEARYRIRFTFNFLESTGDQRTIVREATVWFGHYDNC